MKLSFLIAFILAVFTTMAIVPYKKFKRAESASSTNIAKLNTQITNLSNDIAKLNKPILSATLGGAIIGEDADKNAIVTFLVELSNKGADSAVSDFGVSILLPSRQLARGHQLNSNRLNLQKEDGSLLVLTEKDFLYHKVFETPVKRGSRATGYAPFLLPGYRRDAIAFHGNSVMITYKDVYGTTYTNFDKIATTRSGKWPSLIGTSPTEAKTPYSWITKRVNWNNEIVLYVNSNGDSCLQNWTAEELRQGYFKAEESNDDIFYLAIMAECERRNLRVIDP